MKKDSISKIVEYFEKLEHDTLVLSVGLFRGFNCKAHCGACCYSFTLDYIDDSVRWEKFKIAYPNEIHHFKFRERDGLKIWTKTQNHKENPDRCSYLDMSNGLCKIHDSNPFTCDFEILKISTEVNLSRRGVKNGMLTKRDFGRKWAMKKIDDQRGSLCELVEFRYEEFLKDVDRFKELQDLYTMSRGVKNEKLQIALNFLEDNLEKIEKTNGSFLEGSLIITSEGIINREKLYRELYKVSS